MTHNLSIFLVNSAFYAAVGIWLALGVGLLVSLFTKNWGTIKRVSKYLINSVVFLVIYLFYIELAVVVRPPVEVAKLWGWVNQHIVTDFWIATAIAALLLGINRFFYQKIENGKHKIELVLLTVFNTLVLVGGAWLAGQDAYLGLLEEANRSL